ncbi:MAG: hypothetical protein P8L85_00685 [Rubripirellula sp.]|nr:hypothetical protein [Rubripirellula sp.]
MRELTAWCEAKHSSFSRDSNDALDNAVKEVALLSDGRGHVVLKVMTGQVNGIDVTIYDYAFTNGQSWCKFRATKLNRDPASI